MTKDTVWVTLDEDCWALAEVNLVEMGTLKARMLDSAGNLLSGTKRYAELFEIRGQRTRFLETLTSTNGTIQTKPLDPGTPDDPVKYALVFHWAPLPSVINVNGVWMSPFEDLEHLKTYLGDEGVAVEDLVFVDEPVIDLGTVRLPLPASLQSGYWRGVEGNDIVANKYEAAPGSVITLRGSYHTEAGKMPYRPRLYFGMPSGATLVPGSVVLTVTEGIEPQVSTRPDAVELSFGNGVKEAVSGTVVYRVKLPDDPDTAVCEVRMWGNYQSNKNEEITTITIYVPYVSIEAPSLVWNTDRTVEVSGKATPKATVRVYDMNYFLAETRSSDLGTWRTTVVLPDRGPQANHYLRAEVAIVETDEATSPSWPTGAALTASKVESKAVTLSWPEAQDEVEIAQYVVTGYLSDGSVGVVRTAFPTGTGSIVFRVDDLVPETTYSFKVEALNASYNWSSVPLTLDVTTGPEDTVPPSWSSGAQLTASEVKFTSLVLQWPEATDYEGLKEYRVSCTPNVGTLRNPVTVPPGTQTLLVTGLQRGVEYLFQVEAIDINGNVATLSRAISTLQNDTEPPVWPEGAKLTAIVLDTEVTLDWPLALDNVEVRSYYVYQRTETGWQYKGNTIKTIKYLSPETTYTFKVEAADSSGNLVQNPLEITVTTPPRDVTPPRWEAGAAVTIVTQTWTYCEIDFPSAYDESGIDHYFWYDHQRQGYYTGSATYFGGLEPGKEYTFTILAQDRRGNQTPLEAGLQFTVKAEPGGPEPTWPPGSTVDIVELNPTHVRLKWTKAFAEDFSDGVASYSLTATKDGTVVCGDTVGLSIDTWILGPLVPGETYTFAVEALSRTGKASTNGPKVTKTTPLTDTQPPKWPDGAGLSAWSMSKDRDGTYTVHFAWPQAIEFEKRHYVLEAVDSQGRHAPSSPTIVTQEFGWHLWGLSPAEAYDVTVTAVDLSGNVSVPLTTKVFTPGWMSGASVMSLSGSQGASMSAQDTADNQRVVSSTPIKVKYDKDAVVIKKVTMQQSDGRKVEFEPIGRFVYVWAPSYSFNFDVEFNKPERVTELRIISEAGTVLGGPLETPAQPDTVIATTGPLKASGSRAPGKLYASYMVTPSRTSLIDLPPYDAEVERSSLPSLWTRSTFDEGGVTVTYDDEEENSGTAHVRAFVGGDPRMEVNIRYEFTQAQPGTSTEPSFSYSIDPTSAEFKFTLEVALDPAVIRAHMGAGAQEMGMQAWYHTPAPLVRVFGDTAVHGGLNIETLIDTVSGAHEVQDYEMDLDDLLLGLNPDCPAHHVEYFEALIQMEKDRARTRKVAESVVSIGSIALGVVFPGIGFAVGSWLVSKAFSMYNDIEQDRNFQEIKNEIQADELCRPETPEFKKDLIADPTWIIDPSGYVYEVTPDNRLEGVTATAYQYVQGFGGGSWLPWDATWFEQDNPVLTDREGRYGWDVPEGEWKVYFEKEGYLPAESWEMTVPPPHTDVNIAMVTTEAPEVSSVTADAALGVDIVFSKYMRTSTVTPGTVTVTELEADGTVRMDDAGAPVMVRGVVEPLDAVADPSDAATQLARHFRFVPDFPLVLGEKYLIRINKVVESYTGLSLAADWVGDRTAVLVIPVTGVSLSRKSVTLEVGESTTLAVTIIPENATNQGVSWSSSNTAVATVTQNGTVRGISAGTAIITVTTDDGGYQDTCTVTVKERPSGYDPGDGGEPSGPKPPKEAPADEVLAEETYVLGPGQTTLSVMGGILVLEIPAGAFPAGTKLIIRRLKAEASPTDPTLSVVASPTYEILVQGQGPAKPVTVRFMYCNLCLKGMDPRKLGVYRQSPSDPGTFTYVGGVVDTANHTVTVMLSGFSRCVVLGRNVTFGDIANHWARNEIEVLASRYIVSGVSSTEFQPDRLITRAELAKLLVGMLALDPNTVMPGSAPSTPSFTDVSPDSWYYSVVEMASATGLIKGDAGLFRPNDPVTRQEMAVMLGRALGAGYTVPADAKQSLPFSDASDIAPWASDGVAAAWYWGLMQGMGDNEFQPHGNATRAQAAAVVLRMLELKGLVSGMVTLTGTLSVSEIGGRHFELACDDGKVYVLLAQTAQARNCLEEAAPAASSGSVQVTVTGFLSDAPNVYMRGQLVKAIRVER
jgi:chitodextrinase